MGLVRMIPSALASPFLGAVADWMRRDRILVYVCGFRAVTIAAAAVLMVPLLLLLAAEARFAAYASAWLLGQSERVTAVLAWLIASIGSRCTLVRAE